MPHDHDHAASRAEAPPKSGDAHAGHAHAVDTGRAFVIGVVLNSAIVVVQIIYGIAAHSVALLADAGHNLGDVLGLVLGLGAAQLAKRKPTSRYTYGFRRATILSALANAVLLLVATGGVAWESIQRLRAPEPIEAKTVMIVAGIAVLANGISALFFFANRKSDINVGAAFLHLAGDAATSLGVVVASFVMLKTGWWWLDPVVGLAVSALILAGTWSLLRQSFKMSLDAVPQEIEIDRVRAFLATLPGVVEVHDLHVWAMSTTDTALTAHLVLCVGGTTAPSFFDEASKKLHDEFGIGHATLQVECAPGATPCALAPEDVV